MEPCRICGAAHEAAAPGEVCGAACLRALVARVTAIEAPPVVYDPPSATASSTAPVVIPLGGAAGGSGGSR